MKSSKVKGIHLPPSTDAQAPDAPIESGYNSLERAAMDKSRERQSKFVALGFEGNKKYSKATEIIAQSDFCIRNEPIPYGLDLFPAYSSMWFMRYADLHYPKAKGGPLWIDTPGSRTEIAYCEKKLQAYRSRGIRYTYLKANEDATDAAMRLDPVALPSGETNGKAKP